MSFIIDRRLSGKNKSAVNRQRFIHRHKAQIKKSVSDAVNQRSITDMERGEKISIPKRDIHEPVFGHGQGGDRTYVHPGNREFVTGDRMQKPKRGAGRGAQASNQGEGEDDFIFEISRDEYLDILFEDLALPNLIKKQLKTFDSYKYVRAGYTAEGVPSQINIVRSLRNAHARRIALGAGKRRKLKLLEERLQLLRKEDNCSEGDDVDELMTAIEEVKSKLKRLPFIDVFDLQYNNHIKQPNPSTAAVMFCVMDVSGSMDQATKDVAKRFFILLYLFLMRSYKKVEVVFIRHHISAKEVDEQEFFYSRETGGTVVSSALELLRDIIKQRYSPDDWNIYAAQASDGDNWNDDSNHCRDLLNQQIMPMLQYYAYLEITPYEHQSLWEEYLSVQAMFPEHFAMRKVVSHADIYPVFRDLFKRKQT